jgi:hypothetical protein
VTRLDEICSIVAATFYQISRSAIKKQRISGQYRQVAAIENHVRSSLLEREMAERIPAGMLTAIHQQAGAAGQTSD